MGINNKPVVCRKAIFSEDRRFRFSLTIIWEPELPIINFLMLNPSTADEIKNDPTVERCERRVRMWGFGGLIVTNIFALRATNPDDLYSQSVIIGKDNDIHIMKAAERAEYTVCAWGGHGKLLGRGMNVKKMLLDQDIKIAALKLSKDGQPYHPLYLPYTCEMWKWS